MDWIEATCKMFMSLSSHPHPQWKTFISKKDNKGDDSISFRLNIRRYSSFAQVVFHAQLYSDTPCVTQLFGSPPTPER